MKEILREDSAIAKNPKHCLNHYLPREPQESLKPPPHLEEIHRRPVLIKNIARSRLQSRQNE